MIPVKVTIFPDGKKWCGITEYNDNSIERRYFSSQANAEWYMENIIGRMKI